MQRAPKISDIACGAASPAHLDLVTSSSKNLTDYTRGGRKTAASLRGFQATRHRVINKEPRCDHSS